MTKNLWDTGIDVELRAVIDTNFVIYRTYDTLAEAMAVAKGYRDDGFFAKVYAVEKGTGRNAIRAGADYHELEA